MTQEQGDQLYIVKVRYFSETTDYLSDRQYTYFSEDPLIVGDIVTVPVRDTFAKAKVSAIQVPEAEIEKFRDKVTTISTGSRHEPTTLAEVLETAVIERPVETIIKVTAPEGVPEGAELEVASEIIELVEIIAEVQGVPEPEVVAMTAMVKVGPQLDEAVCALYAQAVRLVDDAKALLIESSEDVNRAVSDLAIIAGIKKSIEDKRKEYTHPINEHLKAINEAFKTFTEPILRADKLVRDKMVVYKAEEARQRQEQEEINRLRMEAAQKEMELKGELSESVGLVEVEPEAPKTVHTDMGSAGMRDCWHYEVVDFAALPDEYKVPDMVMLIAIAKKHHDQKHIPGIRFFNEPVIVVNKR